jgi:hypothetical protein
LCFVVPDAADTPSQVIELINRYVYGTHNAGVEGSIPSLSTIDLRTLSAIARKVGAGRRAPVTLA